MKFNRHPEVVGKHAFLSASKYQWIRYDDEKIVETFSTAMAAARGTRLHNLAAELIELGQKLPNNRLTLNMYVNDGIGFRMRPEQVLYFSPNSFGTADCISFRRERGNDKTVLRIHDLKTGTSRASFDQLKIYSALFCLEYDVKPHLIHIELRIYQNDNYVVLTPDPDDIVFIMEKLKRFDQLIETRRLEEVS